MASQTTPAAPDDVEAMLRAKLDAAQARVDAIEQEYAGVLDDPGVIQEDRDTTAALLDEAKRARNAAQRSLDRLLEGSYGRCAKCGAEIPQERLDAIPDATVCVNCA